LGRTTDSAAGGLVKPAAGSCPWLNGGKHNAKIKSAELPILRPGWIFKSFAFQVLIRNSFGLPRAMQIVLGILENRRRKASPPPRYNHAEL
jgi:hypothetical protein